MRPWIALLAAACGRPPTTGDDAPGADATGDTGPTTTVTGCFDVDPVATGGFAAAGEPFSAAPPTGGIVQIIRGEQDPNVWHVDTALHVASIHPSIEWAARITRLDDGAVLSGAQGMSDDTSHGFVQLQMDGTCSGSLTALRTILDDVDPGSEELERDICPLAGREVEVWWDVVDLTDARTASTSVRGFLALDPATNPNRPVSDVDLCASYVAP
jgi:hypothetical protein